jgi:AcrR family transcriptional regulator
MAPRDAEATRRRLLDAAAAEFARLGIAGARVDRIAEAARTNKAQIYHYFGSTDGLFVAVLASLLP